jgi:hypothetical protein
MNTFRLTVGGREITSLVMDEAEFSSLCDLLGQVRFSSVDPDAHRGVVDRIRREKHLPLMARGTQTEQIFQHYRVATPYLSACVRGFAGRLTTGTITVDPAEAEPIFQQAFARLPRKTRRAIQHDAHDLAQRLSDGERVDALFADLTRKDVPKADSQLVAHVQLAVGVTMAARNALVGDALIAIEGYFQRLLTGLTVLAELDKDRHASRRYSLLTARPDSPREWLETTRTPTGDTHATIRRANPDGACL